MKHMIFTLIVSLLLCTIQTFASESGYNYSQTYEGRFESDLLFQRDSRMPIWRPTHSSISEISCDEAIDSLHETGLWTGNLSKEGECLGSEEAMEQTYGNYLNYLHQQIINTQIPAE
jgi:hypothetical protein